MGCDWDKHDWQPVGDCDHREEWGILATAVRDLARAIVAQEHAGPMGWCPWCGVGWGGDHAPDCIVHRARALLGDSTTREG